LLLYGLQNNNLRIMMMRPGDILGRIFYVVTEINHRIIGI